MPNDEVNEQGRFWLAGTTIDEGRLFPPDAVDGTLTIDGNGKIRLHRRPITRNNPSRLTINNKNDIIIGYLPQTDRFVYLTQIDFFHPLLPISARFCLIGRSFLSKIPIIDGDANIEIALDGFENWLELSFPRYEDREDGTGALISTPTDNQDYELSGIGFDIRFERYWQFEMFSGKGTMTGLGRISLKPRSAKTLLELAGAVLKLEEFLLLLMNKHRSLAWPRIIRQENEFIFYHHSQSNRGRSEIDTFDCWILFPSIAKQFGQILDTWFGQNENFILSCKFYMATRRASALYLEHQFASLVWALEAMSRNQNEIPENKKLSEKITRILNRLDINSKDYVWLKNILDREKEPPLKDRLFSLFKSLPLDFEKSELRIFAKYCADLRNELSHFAGLKQDKSATRTHNDFIQGLIKLTPVLDLLYHTKILQTIGVPNDLIRKAFLSRSENSHHMREAGLPLPDPPAPTLPSPPSGAPA